MDQAESVVRVVLPEEDGSFPGTTLARLSIPRLEGVRVSVFAGRGGYWFGSIEGLADGPASDALFDSPEDLAFAADGSVIVADTDNHAIRRISPAGVVSTLAGGNGLGLHDGPAHEAQFSSPEAVAVAADGTIYIADTDNGLIRRLTPDGAVETVEVEGSPFSDPSDLALDPQGNLLFSELTSHGYQILHLSPEGELSALLDEAMVFSSTFVMDEVSTLFFATLQDREAVIRKVAGGVESTVFEDIPAVYYGVFGLGVGALALAPDGTLYAAGAYGRVVRITSDGEAAIVVDRDSLNNSLDFSPAAILITPEGDLLVADRGMSVIWKISLPADGDEPRP